MKREIIKTGDGSTTIHLPEWNEQYHSRHGAIQEAEHVFIKSGLQKFLECGADSVTILEIGFGTGLNALVTWRKFREKNLNINYTAVEAYPVALEEAGKLNFAEELQKEGAEEFFKSIHNSPWEISVEITTGFHLQKEKKFFQEIESVQEFNLIYFDAFGARVQPELWTEEIFQKMFHALKPNGILVTYAAKGSVRRAMQEVGFTVERLPGPPGKREMLRATKPHK